MQSTNLSAGLGTILFSTILCAQTAAAADFGRDVQPIFRAKCYGCHGPSLQMNNLRLDRRVNAMPNRVGANGATIVPGNSAGSRLYLKISGNQAGLQMPPSGPLSGEEIAGIKAWIDQGADWPDGLSGEAPPSPVDPRVTRMMEAFHEGDAEAFKRMLKEDPSVINRKGPGGYTPLIYAALYGDANSVKLLLELGADANASNDAQATALMYAVDDLEKTRLLLEHQADPNARSAEGRTALVIAASGLGSDAVIKLLLEHGAKPPLKSSGGGTAPLSLALPSFDEGVVRMLLERGADFRPYPISASFRANCIPCVELLIKPASPANLAGALGAAARTGNSAAVNYLLAHGADARSTGGQGMTALMQAASCEKAPVDIVKVLLDRGANVNAKNGNGQTALDLARMHGKTPVVDLLIKASATSGNDPAPTVLKPKPANSVRAAVERSLPALQRTDVAFFRASGCVSCHNNSLTAMTVASARQSGFAIDEKIAGSQLQTIGSYMESWRERALEGDPIPGAVDTISYILLGMAAEKYPPDAATDAMARYIKSRQSLDGRWPIAAQRPPHESSDFESTAVTMRALQAYAPKSQKAAYQHAIERGAAWLAKGDAKTNEDRTYLLLGLEWAGADKHVIRKAARALLSEQRPNGGWAQLASLDTDAYATGQALVALRETGTLAVKDPAYQRGVQYLVNTQLEDGSWYVKTRSLAIQPYFESDFPHGRNQFISAAATNWATMALVPAARTILSAAR